MIDRRHNGGGLLYGIAAYALWGLMPFFFHAVERVPPGEILAERIVSTAVLLVLVLSVFRRWQLLKAAFTNPHTRYLLLGSSLFIAINWYVYIYGVTTKQVVQTSLGYFINPLFTIVLGLFFFAERLRPGQWCAVLLASVGLGYLIYMTGELPWIALVLAGSFGLYGLTRKVAPVDALTGLAAETFILAPLALTWLVFRAVSGSLGYQGTNGTVNTLLLCSGIITTVPLICFGISARRLPLSIMGFLQYLAPSIQFLIGVFVFDEELQTWKLIGFSLIWSALLVLTLESLWARRQRMKQLEAVPAPEEEALAMPLVGER